MQWTLRSRPRRSVSPAGLNTDLRAGDSDINSSRGCGIVLEVHPLVAGDAVVRRALGALLLNGGAGLHRADTQRRKTCVTRNS